MISNIKRKDPESFQNEYSMSKFPGDIKEAQEKQINMTIKEMYLKKKNRKLDWLFTNIYKEPYILQKYGMGVPLLFTMMKMILIVLYILFFINLYGGFQQF